MGLGEWFDPAAREYGRMARAHGKLWQWGLAHLKLFAPLDIADLGCGDGRVLAELLRMFPQAKVTGLYSWRASATTATSPAAAARSSRAM